MVINSKKTLRAKLRAVRQQLTAAQQIQAAVQLSVNARKNIPLGSDCVMAFYWPSDGEISPLTFLMYCLLNHTTCLLPVMSHDGTRLLRFAHYDGSQKLYENNYGILEPSPLQYVEIQDIDIVLTPLVGCTRSGARLGRGGGYYDATFSEFVTHKRPCLIGIAHSFQVVEQIPSVETDQQLDAVITEQTYIQCT